MVIPGVATAAPDVGQAREQLSAAAEVAQKAEKQLKQARETVATVEERLEAVSGDLGQAKRNLAEASKDRATKGKIADVTNNEALIAEDRAVAARALVMRLIREMYANPAVANDLLMFTDFFADGSASLGDFSQQELAQTRVQDRLFERAQLTEQQAGDKRAIATDAAGVLDEAVRVESEADTEARRIKNEKQSVTVELAVRTDEVSIAQKRFNKKNKEYEAAQDEFKEAFLAACTTGTGTRDTSGPPSSSGSQAKLVWDTLLAHGLTPEAAAGILGNLQQESGIDPTTIQNGGPGMGLAQWSRGGRWDSGSNSLLSFAAVRGLDPWNAATQVQFMLWEMEQGWGGFNLDSYKRMTDIAEATVYFHDVFERSADSGVFVNTVRVGYATAWYASLSGTAPDSNITAEPILNCPG